MKKVLGSICIVASTVIAGALALWCILRLLLDIGPALLSGSIAVLTNPTVLLIAGLGVASFMFSRFIGPHFDKLFEK